MDERLRLAREAGRGWHPEPPLSVQTLRLLARVPKRRTAPLPSGEASALHVRIKAEAAIAAEIGCPVEVVHAVLRRAGQRGLLKISEA